MKIIEKYGCRVLVRRAGGHYIAQLEGGKARGIGLTEYEAVLRVLHLEKKNETTKEAA